MLSWPASAEGRNTGERRRKVRKRPFSIRTTLELPASAGLEDEPTLFATLGPCISPRAKRLEVCNKISRPFIWRESKVNLRYERLPLVTSARADSNCPRTVVPRASTVLPFITSEYSSEAAKAAGEADFASGGTAPETVSFSRTVRSVPTGRTLPPEAANGTPRLGSFAWGWAVPSGPEASTLPPS